MVEKVIGVDWSGFGTNLSCIFKGDTVKIMRIDSDDKEIENEGNEKSYAAFN